MKLTKPERVSTRYSYLLYVATVVRLRLLDKTEDGFSKSKRYIDRDKTKGADIPKTSIDMTSAVRLVFSQ